jgi:hypothetical protein
MPSFCTVSAFSFTFKTTFEICDLCNNSIHVDCCELANTLTACYACIGHNYINNQKDQSSNELENTVEQANTSAAIKNKDHLALRHFLIRLPQGCLCLKKYLFFWQFNGYHACFCLVISTNCACVFTILSLFYVFYFFI